MRIVNGWLSCTELDCRVVSCRSFLILQRVFIFFYFFFPLSFSSLQVRERDRGIFFVKKLSLVHDLYTFIHSLIHIPFYSAYLLTNPRIIMSASMTYTPLRDDTSIRSLSINEKTFLRSCATGISATGERTGSILRTDGRSAGESRSIQLSFGREHNISECSVQLGANTRVSSCVTCDLIPPPHSDRPNDGAITFSVDLSPMSSMGFEYVQPVSMLGGPTSGGMGQAQDDNQKLLSNRILRILERTLLNGGAIDAEALCVQSGRWVWRLHVDVTVLDHGGNLVDACVLSAVAALRHFRKPEVEIQESGGPKIIHSDEREPTPLPIHHTPLTVTFALYSDPSGLSTTVSALVDPTHREELVMDGTATFSFNKYGEICSTDFPGGCELKPRQLLTCASLGKRKCIELCDLLEKALIEADNKSDLDRLERLKLVSGASSKTIPLPPIPDDVPFVERTDFDRDIDSMDIDQSDLQSKAAAIAAAEEESYRIQALDFAVGHVAAKVKENLPNQRDKKIQSQGSLMAALLRSAGKDSDNRADELPNQAFDVEPKVALQKKVSLPTNAIKVALNVEMDDSDDDEEELVILHSEFEPESEKNQKEENDTVIKDVRSVTRVIKEDSDGDEADDLAVAIKQKKKSKKKKVEK